MAVDFLLITPPFCQPNTPYPATAYLSAFLRSRSYKTAQTDLSIALLLRIYCSKGLQAIFNHAEKHYQNMAKNPLLRDYCFIQRSAYISVIDPVISFLQGKKRPDSSWIKTLPKGHFLNEEIQTEGMDEEMAAKHRCTLLLEDLCVFIQKYIDPDFGFSKYAEQLGRSAYTFDAYVQALDKEPTLLETWMLELLEQAVKEHQPHFIGFTLPFPGNVMSALRCAQYLKKTHPDIPILMGGGFVNTELREIQEPQFFALCDHLFFDDGEDSMEEWLKERTQTQCIFPSIHTSFAERPAPDYQGLRLSDYFSLIPISNPMHRLWNDGRWIKMTLAHGCYWKKCNFCDLHLDYICRYDPLKPEDIVERIELLMNSRKAQLMAEGFDPKPQDYNGFHFVDEAAPPALLGKISDLILARGLKLRWWTNIRFEKSFDAELCRKMSQAGCIAVSGGLEVASERILQKICKGVSVEQAFESCKNFSEHHILVHAYLMYGFPGQTKAETFESLENVRKLFKAGYIQSAFWHRFALTAHSPMGRDPEAFLCRTELPAQITFAKNDLIFQQTEGDDPDLFTEGLQKALYNYMHGQGLDLPVRKWFG